MLIKLDDNVLDVIDADFLQGEKRKRERPPTKFTTSTIIATTDLIPALTQVTQVVLPRHPLRIRKTNWFKKSLTLTEKKIQ